MVFAVFLHCLWYMNYVTFAAGMHGLISGPAHHVKVMTTSSTAILKSRKFLSQSVFRTGTEGCSTKHCLKKLSLTTRFIWPVDHFIFRWNQSLKPWFETKYRLETKIKPKHKVMLKFWFQTKFKTKLTAKTKVWNQSFGFKTNLNSAVRFQTKRS